MIGENHNTQQQQGNVGDMLRLATQHFRLGQFTLAENVCRNILAIDPENSDAYHLLGIVAYKVSKFDIAEQLISKSLSIDPDFVDAHCNLGDVFRAQGRMEAATGSYCKALAINPKLLTAHFKLGMTLLALGKETDAEAHIQKAIDLDPNNIDIYYSLGVEFGNLGRMEDAEVNLRRVISIEPGYVSAHAHLALTIKHTEYDDDIKQMESLYARQDTDSESKILLAFSLGKSFEDFHEYDKAFYYYSSGNQLKRASFNYSIESDKKFMNKIKETFSGSLLKKNNTPHSSDVIPVFILGMPRSGTTLAEQILSSHPNVHGPGELNYLKHTLNKYFKDYDDLQQADENRLAEAGKEYLKMLKRYSLDAQFITDKLPHNFVFIGMIKLILPQAKIIHCYRDPMDTCLSIFKNNFKNSQNYTNDLTELGQYYNLYRDLMNHWHKELPGFIYDLRYENMVENQETETRALLEYCGLEWNEACLKFFNSNRVVTTSSFHQVRQPIYRGSIQAWKNYETQLKPLQETLNQVF